MKLTPDQLRQVLAILDGIDEGADPPRFGDRIGLFLRQYASGRSVLAQVFAQSGLDQRTDVSVSGNSIGVAEVHSLLPPEVSILRFPLGEVAETVVFCEELGVMMTLVMWLKGPTANRTFNIIREFRGASLQGGFRWFAATRLTPGDAIAQEPTSSQGWEEARCLKCVADDIGRPPHALEYLPDYRLGRPGLKFFRVACVRRNGASLKVLPAFEDPKDLDCLEIRSDARKTLDNTDLSTALIYREPWSPKWTVVSATPITPEQAVLHSLVWTDFQRELQGAPSEVVLDRSVERRLRSAGISAHSPVTYDQTRKLRPVAREVIRRLRGTPLDLSSG